MRATTVLVLVLVLAACGGVPGGPPAAQPDVAGTVTRTEPFEPVTTDCVSAPADPEAPVSSDDRQVCTSPDNDTVGRVLVEEDPASESGDTKIVFTVTGDTAVLVESDGGHTTGTFADLGEGAVVSAWSTGAVAESYPMQATAATIVVHAAG